MPPARAGGMRRNPQSVQGCSRMVSPRVPSRVRFDRGYRLQQEAKERRDVQERAGGSRRQTGRTRRDSARHTSRRRGRKADAAQRPQRRAAPSRRGQPGRGLGRAGTLAHLVGGRARARRRASRVGERRLEQPRQGPAPAGRGAAGRPDRRRLLLAWHFRPGDARRRHPRRAERLPVRGGGRRPQLRRGARP